VSWVFRPTEKNRSGPRSTLLRAGTEAEISPSCHKSRPEAQTIFLSNRPGGSVCPGGTSICRESHEINTPTKFSFGPSQEDEGLKKTVHSPEGGRHAGNHPQAALEAATLPAHLIRLDRLPRPWFPVIGPLCASRDLLYMKLRLVLTKTTFFSSSTITSTPLSAIR
jgi:hypothetical protein